MSGIDRSLALLPGIREKGAWCLLLSLTFTLRLLELGNRPMSYDEGIHAFYSWMLADSGSYYHSPVTHGPLLFYLNALLFLVFQATDFTARLLPALAGLLLVATPLLFRRWIGPAVALSTGFLLAFSPLLYYYSRYLRNDIYIALLVSMWVWACFRYLEDREPRHLYAWVIFSSLAVVCKEVAFLFAAIACAYLLIRGLQQRGGAFSDLAVLHITLFLPFAAPLLLAMLRFEGLHAWMRSDPTAAAGLILMGGAVSTAIAALWWRILPRPSTLAFSAWVRLAALAWGLEALYFSTFGKNPGGIVTGFFGSVDYWLAQHGLARGGQPWFYYLLLLGVYELFPLLLAAVTAGVVAKRARRSEGVSASGTKTRVELRAFCVFWTVAAFVAFLLAGEKMPWLAVHLVLPLCWLGGEGLVLLGKPVLRRLPTGAPLLLVPSLLLISVLSLLQTGETVTGPLAAVRLRAAWLGLSVGLTGAVLILIWSSDRQIPRLRLLFVGTSLLFGLLWLRSGYLLNYLNPESPVELAVYAHAHPEIRYVLERARELSRTGPVNLESTAAWPLRWYLRGQADVFEVDSIRQAVQSSAALIVARAPLSESDQALLGSRYRVETFPYLCWPYEAYQSLNLKGLLTSLSSRHHALHLWNLFYNRFDHAPAEFSRDCNPGGSRQAFNGITGQVVLAVRVNASPGDGIDGSAPPSRIRKLPESGGSQ